MTKPYRPSNGTEGSDFYDKFCERCIEDRAAREDEDYGNGCSIIVNTMAYKITDPNYPPQWVEDDNGDNPRCTAFEEDVGQEPPIRNVSTIKLTA